MYEFDAGGGAFEVEADPTWRENVARNATWYGTRVQTRIKIPRIDAICRFVVGLSCLLYVESE